jgi:hypothetical protein
MLTITAIHSNTSLAFYCATSRPNADPHEMQAHDLRYVMVNHMWSECIQQAVSTLAGNAAWKTGECL